jgi:hypothetical protein
VRSEPDQLSDLALVRLAEISRVRGLPGAGDLLPLLAHEGLSRGWRMRRELRKRLEVGAGRWALGRVAAWLGLLAAAVLPRACWPRHGLHYALRCVARPSATASASLAL